MQDIDRRLVPCPLAIYACPPLCAQRVGRGAQSGRLQDRSAIGPQRDGAVVLPPPLCLTPAARATRRAACRARPSRSAWRRMAAKKKRRERRECEKKQSHTSFFFPPAPSPRTRARPAFHRRVHHARVATGGAAGPRDTVFLCLFVARFSSSRDMDDPRVLAHALDAALAGAPGVDAADLRTRLERARGALLDLLRTQVRGREARPISMPPSARGKGGGWRAVSSLCGPPAVARCACARAKHETRKTHTPPPFFYSPLASQRRRARRGADPAPADARGARAAGRGRRAAGVGDREERRGLYFIAVAFKPITNPPPPFFFP